ncbi:MAG: energy transducer TonB [Bacteroidia bacterium]
MKNLGMLFNRILASTMILGFVCVTATNSQGQTPASKPATVEELQIPESMPAVINMQEVAGRIGYPAEAKANKIEGRVIIRVLVDTEGNVIDHQLVKDPHKLLSDAVLAHAKELKFTPAKDKGKTVKAWVTIPFQFKLPVAEQDGK